MVAIVVIGAYVIAIKKNHKFENDFKPENCMDFGDIHFQFSWFSCFLSLPRNLFIS